MQHLEEEQIKATRIEKLKNTFLPLICYTIPYCILTPMLSKIVKGRLRTSKIMFTSLIGSYFGGSYLFSNIFENSKYEQSPFLVGIASKL